MAAADLTWQFLTELYKKAPVEDFFLRNVFGRNKRYSPLPQVKVRTVTKGISIATLGKKGDPARAVKIADNVTDTLLDPAEIYEYDEITEEDALNNANPAVMLFQGASSVVSNVEYIRALKLKELKDRAVRREEKMLAEILSEGKLSYNDSKREIIVDFQPTIDTYTLGTSTNVYKDLLDKHDVMLKTGNKPDYILITSDVEDALLNNSKIEKYIVKTSYDLGQYTMVRKSVNVRETIRLKGLPPLLVYSGSYEKGGTAYDYISGSKIIFANSSKFRFGYGAIINFKLEKSGRPIMTDAISWESVINEGSSKALYIMSRPLPYLVDSNALQILNVTIS